MPLTSDVRQLLSRLYELGPQLTKGNLARSLADAVGEAASRGFITTLFEGEATRLWRLTPVGLAALQYGQRHADTN